MGGKKKADAGTLDQEIYQQLKGLAHSLMSKERDSHTLSATDLVHEAFVKLSFSNMSFNDQKHYYHTFARQMRRVLVNHSNKKNAKKNRAEAVLFTESLELANEDMMDFETIDNAITHLEKMDSRSAHSIELTYFTQLPQAKIAEYLGVSLATLERDLKFGRVIIHEYVDNSK